MSGFRVLYRGEVPEAGLTVTADTHDPAPVEVRSDSNVCLFLNRDEARQLARALKRARRASRDYVREGGKPDARA